MASTLLESGVLIFLKFIEKVMEVRYNKLSDLCNLLKAVRARRFLC